MSWHRWAMSTNIHQQLYTEWWRSSPCMTPSLLLMHDEKCHPRNAQSQETHAAPWGLPNESTSDGVHSRGDSCQQPAFRTLSPYTRSIAWKEGTQQSANLGQSASSWVCMTAGCTMLKADAGKRKVQSSEDGPKAKRQKPSTPAEPSGKREFKCGKKATISAQPSTAGAVALSDLPDNVMANVFSTLGLDRLRAMQGKLLYTEAVQVHMEGLHLGFALTAPCMAQKPLR